MFSDQNSHLNLERYALFLIRIANILRFVHYWTNLDFSNNINSLYNWYIYQALQKCHSILQTSRYIFKRLVKIQSQTFEHWSFLRFEIWPDHFTPDGIRFTGPYSIKYSYNENSIQQAGYPPDFHISTLIEVPGQTCRLSRIWNHLNEKLAWCN